MGAPVFVLILKLSIGLDEDPPCIRTRRDKGATDFGCI
jgi:hypothetical protein